MSDESKTASSEQTKANPEQPKDKIEDLNAEPFTDTDAQSVKGGRAKLGDIKGEYPD